MLSKVAFLVCLCVSSSFGAGLPRHLQPVARDQNGEAIELSHKPYEARFADSSLKVSCLDGGLISLELSTPNFAKKSNIIVGTNGAAGCKSADFAFPAPAGQDGKLTLSAGELCGRQLIEGTETTANQYRWNVEVNENVLVAANSATSRPFKFKAEVSCEQKPGDSEVDAPHGVDPIDEGTAEFDQTLQFTIDKTVPLVNGKWEFTLKPTVTGSLGELNYKIHSCIAKPIAAEGGDAIPDTVQAAIIADSCINDLDFFDVAVNVADSPTKQILSVYPFALSDYEEHTIQLSCTVNLCKGADCSQIKECSANEEARRLVAVKAPARARGTPIVRRAQRPASKKQFSIATTF